MKTAAGAFQAGKTVLVSAILVILLAFSGLVERTDRWWFDSLQAIGASRAPVPQNTALVLIDEQTLTALGNPPFAMRWPWPRAAFAALLAGLEAAGAERILVDLVFFESSAAAEQDLLLGAVAAGLPGVVLATVPGRLSCRLAGGISSGQPGAFRRQNRWGFVRSLTDADSVIRRYIPRGSLAAAALPPLRRRATCRTRRCCCAGVATWNNCALVESRCYPRRRSSWRVGKSLITPRRKFPIWIPPGWQLP